MQALSALLLVAQLAQIAEPKAEVGPVPEALRAERQLDVFYQKHLDLAGFAILGSARVSDAALHEARWILAHMLEGREDVLRELTRRRVHLVVMAHDEYTTDVPEQRQMSPAVYWDRRARGLGGSPVSCAEENLLCFPGDPYSTENILVHEFAHVVHGHALRGLDPTFDKRLREAFKAARDAGLWENAYASTSHGEYWAEAVQCWFDDNRENDALHNHVDTREELREYDPRVAALCEEVFGDRVWRYLKPRERAAGSRAHLADVDFDQLPTFRWRAAPIPTKPRVVFDTAEGSFVVELDYEAAPLTVENFLRYVHEGFYSDGEFFRTVTRANQPADAVPIEVVQARANQEREGELFPPIPLERTGATGLRHVDGTLSMARLGPDTAQDHFFVCVGVQPELDFGGRRNPDGQGFAAFGQVIENMELLRRIHAFPADGQALKPPVRIQRAVRQN
jgi:cyclophilin family peptidyl-prolyl cis-trans isomerase